MKQTIKAVILCGGKGTRIREASELLPKPMLPIGSRPMLWHIMKGYAHHGFDNFVLCLGYKGWTIKEFFLNYVAMTSDVVVRLGKDRGVELRENRATEDWCVTLADTGENTMTAGRLAAIRKYVEMDDLFMVTYGDGVANVDIPALVAFHRSHGKIATVTAVRPPARFGELGLDGNIVREFAEKPQARGGFINGGFFVCDAKRVWDYVGTDATMMFEEDPLRNLASDGELAAFTHEGFWMPVDTLREHTLLNQMWESNRAPWKVWPED